MRFNPPPNWPPAPAGYKPPDGWQPDPAWGPPPPGWDVWVLDTRRVWLVVVGLFVLLGAGLGIGFAVANDEGHPSSTNIADCVTWWQHHYQHERGDDGKPGDHEAAAANCAYIPD